MMIGAHPDAQGHLEQQRLEAGEPSLGEFERITVGKARILARAEAVPWSREAVRAYGSLHRAACERASRTLRGRGPVPIVDPEGIEGAWVVRRYYRGGLMRVLSDRFIRMGRPRSLRELERSARIEELGFATPRIMAAAVYPSGVFYRADLVTELVPHARTLADVLFGRHAAPSRLTVGDARREALACAADLIRRLATAGVHHKDLNAHNILIAREPRHVHAVLLDLDHCRVAGPSHRRSHRPTERSSHGPSNPVEAGKMRRRLRRSIRKLGRERPRPRDDDAYLTAEEMDHLLGEREQP